MTGELHIKNCTENFIRNVGSMLNNLNENEILWLDSYENSEWWKQGKADFAQLVGVHVTRFS